jgi:hypothetical protein
MSVLYKRNILALMTLIIILRLLDDFKPNKNASVLALSFHYVFKKIK